MLFGQLAGYSLRRFSFFSYITFQSVELRYPEKKRVYPQCPLPSTPGRVGCIQNLKKLESFKNVAPTSSSH